VVSGGGGGGGDGGGGVVPGDGAELPPPQADRTRHSDTRVALANLRGMQYSRYNN
jgi:hypothetical protein